MSDKIWKAKWITDNRFCGLSPLNVFHKQFEKSEIVEHRADLKNLHMLVRKEFYLFDNHISAHIDITADDYYKLFVNGRFVGQGPAPSYYYHYNYNRYDLSDYLMNGKNIIAVHVYYQGLVNRVWNSGDYRQGMIGELFVDDVLKLATDGTWKYTIAREFTGTDTIGYETQYLEDTDYRLKETGWRSHGYNDDKWLEVYENPFDDHKLVSQITPSLDVYRIQPREVKMLGDGLYFLDFGQEITGQLEMKASGDAGLTIEIKYGEELEEDSGHLVKYKMRCNCTYIEKWILSGNEDILEQFDYKAFRYVEVSDPKGCVDADSFCAVVRHYLYDNNLCLFKSSNALLNGIWDICKNGVRYGCQEVYVDCPSREKGQYLGDAVITAQSQMYLTGDMRLFKKLLMDFALSTHICPGMMAVAPGSFMQEIADFSLLWPFLLLKYYWHSGDVEFLGEMYPVAEGIITYFSKYERDDRLLENVKEKWNLVDWPDNSRDGYDFDLSPVVGNGCHNVINAFYCGAVKTVDEIRDILGIAHKDDFSSLKSAFINAFYRDDKRLFADSTVSSHTALHSNIIPLFFGLVPEEAVKSIVVLIREKRFKCSVYNAYFLLKGLAEVGEYELIYELITSEDRQSWANMIREGATACFEAWGKDQKWNTSLCHPWASAPIPVLIEDIIGLKPRKPGWEQLDFAPHIPKSLTFLTFEMTTLKGKIRFSFNNGDMELVSE